MIIMIIIIIIIITIIIIIHGHGHHYYIISIIVIIIAKNSLFLKYAIKPVGESHSSVCLRGGHIANYIG